MGCKHIDGELCHEGGNTDIIDKDKCTPEKCDFYVEESFTTLDTGKRQTFESGMQRDITTGKIRPDLMFPLGMLPEDAIGDHIMFLIADDISSKHKELWNDFNEWYWQEGEPIAFAESVLKIEGAGIIKRYAALLARGAEKYDDRNWEKANGEAELERGKQSAFRHFVQYLCGDTDEDHICAVLFNIQLVELVRYKIANKKEEEE